MNLKEKLSHFWNETLGVDCPDEVDILASNKPEDKELQASIERVNMMENQYKASNSAKSGKGRNISLDSKVVERVEIDTKNATKIAEQKIASQKTAEDRER